LPRERRLSGDCKTTAEMMLRLKGNKKILQQHLQTETGRKFYVMNQILFVRVTVILADKIYY